MASARPVMVLLALSLAALPSAARAFDSDGHDVIEALVYRTLVEGRGTQPPRPDVLRNLFNDGALVPPICFGQPHAKECKEAPVANPLLLWPQPRSDRPDLEYRRQFSDEGQCFHFMATISDEESEPIPGTHIPRALATRAVVRCRDLLDRLLDSVVEVGGKGTRESGYGLYELVHAVQDSFSYAHTQRQEGTRKVEFLRVWEPIGKLAGSRLGVTYSESPTRHDSDEPRDRAFINNFAEVEGRPCRGQVPFPYTMPYACLSTEGEEARQAVVELLILVNDLRQARLAGSPGPRPSETPEWRAYEERWFSSVYACDGDECTERQFPMRAPASNFALGAGANYSPTVGAYGASIWGVLMQTSPELNPFVYAISGTVGYQRAYQEKANLGAVALNLDLLLPFGRHAAAGLSPAQVRVVFGSGSGAAELATQLVVLYWRPIDNLWFAFRGPVELNWSRGRAEWSFGIVAGIAPSSRDVSPGSILPTAEERADRHDDEWGPEPLWYGRLKGRVASIYGMLGVTAYTQPADGSPLTIYGFGGLGASVFWDRDHWGGRLPSAWGLSLLLGDRHTTGTNRYLVAALSGEFRWYVLGGLGLSIVPARVEIGPKVTGTYDADPSPFVVGQPPGQFYFQAGSRLGIALNAGIIDLLVQAPTLAWSSQPFQGGEILSFQLGVKIR